jgi:hypothetical protein
VVIIKENRFNYADPPLNRPRIYYEFKNFPISGIDASYKTFDMVREGFRLSSYDIEDYGTNGWNLLGFLVKPGKRFSSSPI